MSKPSASEYQQARALIAERHALRTTMEQLEGEIKLVRATNEAASRAQTERVNFNAYPERLAGLVELARRNTPYNRLWLQRRYDMFLESMVEAILPRGRPRKVDFHALPLPARPYLLAPFLGLVVGNRYPQLCLDHSDPAQGRLTYICTAGPADPALWAPLLPNVNAWLGHNWTITGHTASTITLTCRPPLPAIIPFEPRFLRQGALFTGFDVATYQATYIPIADMTSGTFIPGNSGSGKSAALHLLLQSIFANLHLFSAVFLVDGKDGVTFNPYAGRHPKVHVLWDERDLWALTTQLVEIMRQRNVLQRQRGVDNTDRAFVALVIDEMSTYAVRPSSDAKYPDNKLHSRFLDELAMLARRGRSTGLRMIVTAQEPVADQIPVTVRNNCQTIMAFRVPVDAHATALFGQLDRLPADPRDLPRGRALIKHGLTGTLQAVQLPLFQTGAQRS